MGDLKLSKKQINIILGGILLFGLLLRLIYFDRITFGYGQARDALSAINI